MVVWYKGPDTDDKEVVCTDEIYHTHEQAVAFAESIRPAESNPGGATNTNIINGPAGGGAAAPFLLAP